MSADRARQKKRLAVVIGIAAALAVIGLAFVLAVAAVRADLSPGASGPLVVTDRNGRILRSVPARHGRPGRSVWVTLDRIPSSVVLAIVASEDHRFFRHHGVDPAAVVRALRLNLSGRGQTYGGSTLTMQLGRMVYSEGRGRTILVKAREAVLALFIEAGLTKNEILEQYLNRAYFGNGAWGIEDAAQTYFGKPASGLSRGEALLLAVVPRSPARYDPVRHLDAAMARRAHVIGLMAQRGMITDREAGTIAAEPIAARLHAPPFEAPHAVDWVLSTLPADVAARGGLVRTTIDLGLEERLETVLRAHVAALRDRGVSQAGLVVLDTRSGGVLAMIGSADYAGPSGRINIATWRRHPGSALKPFVYALAIENGASPASVAYDIIDVDSEYRMGPNACRERGPVRFREALAGSYNLAAVHVLERIGVDRLVTRLRQAGVGEVTGLPSDYGLDLALGATKVRLLDLAQGYGFLVRQGRVIGSRGILEVRGHDGGTWLPDAPEERRIFSEQASWLVMNILSDPEARRPMFGRELPFDDLPFAAAFKTGTSSGFSDTVAVGATEQVTAAAWAGNFDGASTQGLIAMEAAAPLVRAALLAAARGRRLALPGRPSGVTEIEVCALSGQPASPDCPHRKIDLVLEIRRPKNTCSWHVRENGRVVARPPDEVARWLEAERHAGGRIL